MPNAHPQLLWPLPAVRATPAAQWYTCMRAWELLPVLPQGSDQVRHHLPFPSQVVCPPGAVLPGALGAALDEPQQEEQPGVGAPERVAFEVEEDVAVVGLWQQTQSVPETGSSRASMSRCGGGIARRLPPGLLMQAWPG